MFRTPALVALFTGVVFCSADRDVQAQPGASDFTYTEYTGKDGKLYKHPSWFDQGGGDVTFRQAQGNVKMGPDYTIVNGNVKIDVEGPLKGSWTTVIVDPTITVTKKDVLNEQVVTGLEKVTPPTPNYTFKSGAKVRLYWALNCKDKNGAMVTLNFGPDAATATPK